MTIVVDKVLEELATQAVNKLVQTVADNVTLVRGIESEIMDLTSDVETFNARLVDASMNPRANQLQLLEVVVKKFRTIVNETQDVVATYIALKKKHEDNALAKCLDKIPVPVCGNVSVCASKIQFIRTKLNTIRQDHEKDLLYLMNYLIQDPPPLQAGPVVEEDYVMGFDNDLTTIKARLIEESNDFIVISIVGMPGTGKTTFAKKIFKDPDIRNKFVHCILVHVSQGFNRKQKFMDILNQIIEYTGNIGDISEQVLEQRIKELLEHEKYFIVIDDVWEKKDWDSLKAALPKSEGSRILATTRDRIVAKAIGEPHSLQMLDPEVSWLLLEKNVFGEKGDSKPFEAHGRKIAGKCNGLPLALVVIAGILRKSRIPADWRRVAENPFLEINKKDQSYHKIIMLSYDHLPHEKLKNCFLYFSSFPTGHAIPAWKLICLWIAEEFIPTTDEWGNTLDMEVEAQKYLNDLVDRNLVKVLKRRADGQIKICSILDSLHEFCKSEAARKNLFHVMDGRYRLDAKTLSPRRLCSHSSISDILVVEKNPPCLSLSCYNKKRSPRPFGKHVHSLLVSSLQKSEIHLTQEQLATIPNTFPLLRVLDIESIKFNSLPNKFYALDHLRYLAITTDLKLLPKPFKNFRELETLVFKTVERTLEINGGIWNMEKLRHLHTNTSAHLPSPRTNKNSSGTTDIRTLSTISPASCTEEIFSKTPNLQKLGVCGNLAELLEVKEGICLFNNLQKLDYLENLKLHGQSKKVLKVPMLDKFACRLRKLTLSNTLFEWDDISILGLLEELEVLKLDENAFIGNLWNLNDNVVFKQLQYLRIGRTELVTWTTTEKSFPVLESLVLRNCSILKGIPYAFAEVHSLKVMELFHVSEKAANSAREIKVAKTNGFDLSITSLPPQETVHNQTQGKENVNANGLSIAPEVERSDVVGFDNEVKIVKDRLIGGLKSLTIISIEGIAGLGKTTLAQMLFRDYELQYKFFICIWVYVSRTFNRKQIFLDILSLLTDKPDECHQNMSEEQLAFKISSLLEGETYFVVMDDVRTVQDWDNLRIAFPNNMRGSRVLVTTRHHEVALYADSVSNPHQLSFLRDEKSWELLEKKVFGEERCPDSLESVGKIIATKCNGVPLRVALIAGVLNKCETPAEWEQMGGLLPIIDYENQDYNPLMQLIYGKMDLNLKDCFLYLAAFPIGHEIAASKLIHLWIAEGFIPLTEDGYTSNLECTAEKYLKHLVDMNLLMVLKRRADDRIKTCCIHDALHEFCKTRAAERNFFHEMGEARLKANEIRRLCVHSSILDFLESESKTSSQHVRSFLFSCSKEIEIPDKHLAAVPKSFPLLRVMDVESFKFKSLPKELYNLYYLRYLAVSADQKLLPKLFNNLSDMQTLVFNTSQNSLEVKAEIWSMPKLRHVHSNTSIQLPPSPKNSKNISRSTDIQTLSTISPSSCTGEIFDKTPNLQKLGIRGNLVELMESKGGTRLFDNLQKLCHLKNLKLLNSAINGSTSRLRSASQHNKFPQRLRKLTLSNTCFEWEDMYILGALDELQVLKLEENAFMGEFWELNNIVFKQLQFLRIGRTDLMYWSTTQSSFPVLKTLELKHCFDLKEVPSIFADVDSLKLLKLFFTNKMAADSAMKIHKLKHENGNAQNGGFQLSICPPYL